MSYCQSCKSEVVVVGSQYVKQVRLCEKHALLEAENAELRAAIIRLGHAYPNLKEQCRWYSARLRAECTTENCIYVKCSEALKGR